MKIFKFKYFAASLIIHSSFVISLFCFNNSVRKSRDNSMLITEVIKIEETSKLNDSKKTKIPR